MGLRVLITNFASASSAPGGTVIYVRDLALELQRLGHTPSVFSSIGGSVADELRATGVFVSDRLSRLDTPDIIHGHYHAPTLLAVKHWPTVPAIHICHNHLSPHDRTPRHERIRRHFGVSRVCVQRLVDEGVAADRVALLLNFVDTARFLPRLPLPARPRRALVFSNYANEESHLPAVREACLAAGLELDVAGLAVGNVLDEPERVLGSYDIVFAKGKAAIEAMAVGCAVILCDYAGVGPMVTAAEFDWLRDRNFGFEALREPLAPEPIRREIARYDADDAARVRDLIRAHAGLDRAVERLVAIYHEVIAEYRSEPPSRGSRRVDAGAWRERFFLRLYWAWMAIPRQHRERIKRLPGFRRVLVGVRRRL
jgi:glycosyltransferase involved in cell wall biosynthesis